MARIWLYLSAWSMLELCRLLISLIGKMISSMVIILSLKFKMIPNSFMASAKNEVILWPIILVIFDHIRLHMVPFAIRIFEEVQLHPGFLLRLEDPIQSLPRPWNQPF
jgi:hypothetical protein